MTAFDLILAPLLVIPTAAAIGAAVLHQQKNNLGVWRNWQTLPVNVKSLTQKCVPGSRFSFVLTKFNKNLKEI